MSDEQTPLVTNDNVKNGILKELDEVLELDFDEIAVIKLRRLLYAELRKTGLRIEEVEDGLLYLRIDINERYNDDEFLQSLAEKYAQILYKSLIAYRKIVNHATLSDVTRYEVIDILA